MAFFAMVLATGALLVVGTGLFILLIGIILDIIWRVRKKKEKNVPTALKVFAILLTILGTLQGIVPLILFVGTGISSKIKYRSEVSSLPKDSIIYMDDYSDIEDQFDFKGKHLIGVNYKPNNILTPAEDNEDFKTETAGAIIFDNGKHYLIKKIRNDTNADIYKLGLIYDPYVPEDEYDELTDYYLNKAPLYCKYNKTPADELKTIDNIDSERIRSIRDYVINNEGGYDSSNDNSFDGYLYFYSKDTVYYINLNYYESDKGLVVEYNGKYAVVSDEDAAYLKSLK